MSRRPTIEVWMPIHFSEVNRACGRMDLTEEAIFLRLLRDQWLNGPPADDERSLARSAGLSLTKWRAVAAAMEPHFTRLDGRWLHEPTENRRLHALGVSVARKGAVGSRQDRADRTDEAQEIASHEYVSDVAKRAALLAMARRAARHTAEEWSAMVNATGNQCLVCGVSGDQSPLTKDHVVSIYSGGSDGIDNLQPLCRTCNSSKGVVTGDFRPSDWRSATAALLPDQAYNAPTNVDIRDLSSPISEYNHLSNQEGSTDSQVSTKAEVIRLPGRGER